jgi:hypothetical protein
MKPPWDDSRLSDVVCVAVESARDPGKQDTRIVAQARTPGACVSALALRPPWTLVVVTSEVDGVMVPMELSPAVRSDAPPFVARGAAWWPTPGATRWLWTVGRIDGTPDQAALRVQRGGTYRPLVPAPSGWFAAVDGVLADEAGEGLVVQIRGPEGWREFPAAPSLG